MKAPLALCLGAVVLGCSATPPPEPSAPASPSSLAPRPLEDSLPGGGIRQLLQLKPREIVAHPALAPVLARLLPGERRRAFVERTGAEPSKLDRVWFASYPLGRLWGFDARGVGDAVERRLREHARSVSARATPVSDRTFTFVLADEPGAFYRNDDWAVVALGDPSLATIARARAQGRVSRSPSALGSLALAPLASLERDALARWFVVGPFEAGPQLEGLAAAQLAARVAGTELRLRFHLLGAWEGGHAAMAQDWSTTLTGWLDAEVGRALGGGERLTEPQLACHPAGGSDPRTADLDLCEGELAFALERLAARWTWLRTDTLGELVDVVRDARSPDVAPLPSAPEPAGSFD